MPSNGAVIPHSRPTIAAEDVQAVEDTLRSGLLAQGHRVRLFEEAVAAELHRRDGVATSSGTAALYLAMRALGIGEGDEVILPSYTCVAPIHAIRLSRGTPVLVDIDRETFNICPDDTRRRLTPRTKAIIVPHMFGRPADLAPVLNIGLPVIEDCAQSLGAQYRGKPVGSFGVLAVCSFYATKVITTGEGGMILSDSPELLERARDEREYDRRDDAQSRFNFKMTEFQAGLGLTQLRRLETFVARRRDLAATYTLGLASTPIDLPREDPDIRHIFYRYVGRCPHARALAAALQSEGIESPPPVFRPLHHLIGGDTFPQTEEAAACAFSLPIYPSLTIEQTDRILATTLNALKVNAHQWDRFSLASSAR